MIDLFIQVIEMIEIVSILLFQKCLFLCISTCISKCSACAHLVPEKIRREDIRSRTSYSWLSVAVLVLLVLGKKSWFLCKTSILTAEPCSALHTAFNCCKPYMKVVSKCIIASPVIFLSYQSSLEVSVADSIPV